MSGRPYLRISFASSMPLVLIRSLYSMNGTYDCFSSQLRFSMIFRYRKISTFGRDTIRRFAADASAMKKLAARDFEDLLMVCSSILPASFCVTLTSQITSAPFLSLKDYFLNHTTPSSWIFFLLFVNGMLWQNSGYTLIHLLLTFDLSPMSLDDYYGCSRTEPALLSIPRNYQEKKKLGPVASELKKQKPMVPPQPLLHYLLLSQRYRKLSTSLRTNCMPSVIMFLLYSDMVPRTLTRLKW